MNDDLAKVSKAALLAELERRESAERMLRDVDRCLAALGDDRLVIRLDGGGPSMGEPSFGRTSWEMRGLLRDAMRLALVTKKSELDAVMYGEPEAE